MEKIEVLKRAKKETFYKGVSPWILSKNRNFSYGCFLQKLCEKKNRVLIFWIKNKHCKTKKMTFYRGPKNEHFLKGLVLGFCAKIEISPIAFFFQK